MKFTRVMRSSLLLPVVGAGGCLLILHCSWLAIFTFVALVPLIAAAESAPTLRAALFRVITHWYLFALGGFYWIFHVTHRFGGLSVAMSVALVFAFGLLNMWQGLFACVLFRTFDRASLANAWLARIPRALRFGLCFAVAWHSVPALFHWDICILARPLHWFIQALDLFGGFGLDLLIATVNFAVYEAWRAGRVTRTLKITTTIVALCFAYGAVRVGMITQQMPTADILLVQPNLDSAAKNNPAEIRDSLHTLMALSAEAIHAHPDPALLVWPESVFPLDASHDEQLAHYLATLTRDWNAPLLLGGNQYEPPARGVPFAIGRDYNTAFFFTPGESVAQSYRKHVLLAFGEYVPFEDWIPAIRRLVPDRVGAFGRGDGPTFFTTPNGLKIAPVICYESIHPDYMRAVSAQQPNLVVEITNDGWYGQTAALLHHKNLAWLRAVENRITLARDTNTGITAVIHPDGSETEALPLETAGVLYDRVSTIPLWSFYRAYGWCLKPICQGLVAFGMMQLAWVRFRTRRNF